MQFATPRIDQATDELPAKNLTTIALHALDFIVPGEWSNLVGFDATIVAVAGCADPARVSAIRSAAIARYADSTAGYQKALWIYRTVDTADMALGAAALTGKAAQKIPFLSFLRGFTPGPDTVQALDLAVKISAEIIAFFALKGTKADFSAYPAELRNYSKDSVMRMAALACFDGLIPLGPNFATAAGDILSRASTSQVSDNSLFRGIRDMIPGINDEAKKGFITEAYASAQAWIERFVTERNITRETVLSKLREFIEITDDKLDYLGALLDISTNYYAHTGTQTVARKLIERVAQDASL